MASAVVQRRCAIGSAALALGPASACTHVYLAPRHHRPATVAVPCGAAFNSVRSYSAIAAAVTGAHARRRRRLASPSPSPPSSLRRGFFDWFNAPQAQTKEEAAAAERLAKAEREYWEYDKKRKAREVDAQSTWAKRSEEGRIPGVDSNREPSGDGSMPVHERYEIYRKAFEWKKREAERKKENYSSWNAKSDRNFLDEEQQFVPDFTAFVANLRANRLRQSDARSARITLGLGSDADSGGVLTVKIVKKAFQVRALATHPDSRIASASSSSSSAASGERDGAAVNTDEFIRVQKAYELLMSILTDDKIGHSYTPR